MADVTIKVLTAATNFDLLTLEEAKTLLGISAGDTTHDEAMTMWITTYSLTVAEMCNRTFAREKVTETWREEEDGRLFLSHYPVKEDDIEFVGSAGLPYMVGDYELEEASGKLSNIITLGGSQSAPWAWPTVVTYTGGYVLPDEAPPPLKQATAMLIREEKVRNQQAQTAGIRQISHKESRVAFFDPNAAMIKAATAKSQGLQAAEALLKQYMRFWV